MKKYSLEERIDMILIIGECEENCLLASRIYGQKYPHRNHPKRDVFERLLRIFKRTGSVAYEKVNRRKHIVGDEGNEFSVIQSVVENPHTSQRQISREIGISRRSVSRILKNHAFHPYRIQLHQELYERDFQQRIDFCLWAIDKLAEDESFFECTLFCDECTFHNNGLVNRHNFHFYSDVNPHFTRTINYQQRWSVNVWGGIMGSHVIGPHFFNGNLNGNMFNMFLRNNLPELLEDIPLDAREKMWLQLDGAPAHFQISVRNYLNRHFPNKCIGRDGPQNWPARSPDLTCIDFFLWGYVKNIVYATEPTTPENMMERIRAAFEGITQEMLVNVQESFKNRIFTCVENDGRQFEYLF